MTTTLRDKGGRKTRRHVLPMLFSAAVHGALAGAIFGIAANKPLPPPERVYRVSLAELAPAPEPPAPGPPAAQPGPPEAPAPPPPPKPPPPKPPPPKPPPVVRKPEPKPPPAKRISVKKRQDREQPKPKPRPKEVAAAPPPPPPRREPPRAATSEQVPSSPSSRSATAGIARPVAGGRPGGGGRPGQGRGAAGAGVNPNAVYSQDKVDQRPAMTRAASPQYPSRARRMGVEGKVLVRLVVDRSGSPRNCAAVSAQPPGYFEEAAAAAACRSRFSPGKIKGQPVNTMVVIPFAFRLR